MLASLYCMSTKYVACLHNLSCMLGAAVSRMPAHVEDMQGYGLVYRFSPDGTTIRLHGQRWQTVVSLGDSWRMVAGA